jgi:hypothetical protein
MKKAIIISAVAVFSVFLAGCGGGNQQSAQTGQEQNAEKAVSADSQNAQPQSQENKISASLKDLLGMGKTVKCNSTNTSDKFSTTGTTYVSGEKVRSDVVSQMENAAETNSHIIVAGGWMYMWNEGAITGIKIDTNSMKQNNPPAADNSDQGTKTPPADNQFDSKANFDCSPWTADESVFAIPQGVTFTDQSAALNNLKNSVPQTPGNACAVCDSIPNAEAKAQCKANCSKD